MVYGQLSDAEQRSERYSEWHNRRCHEEHLL